MSDNAASDTPAANNGDNALTDGDNAASKPEIDWKSESRKWESRAKENRRAANERDELAKAIGDKDATIEALRPRLQTLKPPPKSGNGPPTRPQNTASAPISSEEPPRMKSTHTLPQSPKHCTTLSRPSPPWYLRPEPRPTMTAAILRSSLGTFSPATKRPRNSKK